MRRHVHMGRAREAQLDQVIAKRFAPGVGRRLLILGSTARRRDRDQEADKRSHASSLRALTNELRARCVEFVCSDESGCRGEARQRRADRARATQRGTGTASAGAGLMDLADPEIDHR